MRIPRSLGIAMLALVIGIFAGRGSASASVQRAVFCKVKQTLCTSANLWGSEVTIKAKSEKVVILGTIPVTCKSEITLLSVQNDTDRILGEVTSFTWTNCTGCNVVTTTTSPLFSAFPTGKLDFISTTVWLEKQCTIFNVHCTATFTSAALEFDGGTIGGTAKLLAKELPLVQSGGVCGTDGKWDAGPSGSSPYVVTEVSGSKSGEIWISSESHA